MVKECFKRKRFMPDTLTVITNANKIIESYMSDGYKLTVRQLYYRFVALNLFPEERKWVRLDSGKWIRDPEGTKNADPNYAWLKVIVTDARLAGLIDWDAIEDRTRELKGPGTRFSPHWKDPEQIIYSAAAGYKIDKWKEQDFRIEIWVEKEALAGVFDRVAHELDVPYFCCRGYTSISAVYVAAERLKTHVLEGYTPYILHFGDHDPSGIDMTRDIMDRMELFGCEMKLTRLALNMDQVEEYEPPPDPAKASDSRFAGYVREFGNDCWELDALEPQILSEIARREIINVRDEELWRKALEKEQEEKDLLMKTSDRWEDVTDFLIEE